MHRTSGLIVNQTWHGSSLGEHGIQFFFYKLLFYYSQLTGVIIAVLKMGNVSQVSNVTHMPLIVICPCVIVQM